MPIVRKWLWNIAIAYDQMWNAVLGGDPQETISSRIGKVKRRYGGELPWYRPVLKFIDSGLEYIDENHTIESINDAQGDDELWKW
jgi:hypothetical protein